MTPAEKQCLVIGKRYTINEGTFGWYPDGEVVLLTFDDGTSSPFFSALDGTDNWYIPVESVTLCKEDAQESNQNVAQEGSTVTKLKDSGERREVSTGAVRDRAKGKGRFDLLPLFGVYSAAMQMEQGAEKYNARNWEKGMPLSWFADAASRHLGKFIAGYDDEPHLRGAIWNLMCLSEGQERIRVGLWPAELDDLPKTYAGIAPPF